MIGDNHKGETLYLWETSSGKVWKYFGDKETHPKYTGEVWFEVLKRGIEPDGLGFLIYPLGYKGIYSNNHHVRYVGSWKKGKEWNGTLTKKNGTIISRYVNGEKIEQ